MAALHPLPAADEHLLAVGRALREAGYHFTTVTPATHARVNGRAENAQADRLEDVFGWSRPFHPDLLPPGMLQGLEQAGALAHQDGLCRSEVRASTLDGQLFFHSAFPTTAADAVFFGPDTYRFVQAVHHTLRDRSRPVRRAVDIGCGAGPGGIATAKALPNAETLMVDINEAALRFARVNARLADTPNAEARLSDLLSGVEGQFDLVIANPPYLVDPAERAYRHGGGPLGAALSLAILDTALERLSPGGTLVLYTGVAIVKGNDPFRSAVADRLSRAGLRWSYREIDPDVFGEELDTKAYVHADRIAAVVLTVDQEG